MAHLAFFVAAPNCNGYLRVEADLPALTGSPKQVKWATEIRERKLAEIALEIGEYNINVRMGRHKLAGPPVFAPNGGNDAILSVLEKLNSEIAQRGALDKIVGMTSAAFWIDHRDHDPVSLAKAAMAR